MDWEDASDGSLDLVLVMDGVWERSEGVVFVLVVEELLESGRVELVLEMEGDLVVGELLREPFNESFDCEFELLRLMLLMLGIGEGLGAVARETILIPLLVLVAAGMNNVV